MTKLVWVLGLHFLGSSIIAFVLMIFVLSPHYLLGLDKHFQVTRYFIREFLENTDGLWSLSRLHLELRTKVMTKVWSRDPFFEGLNLFPLRRSLLALKSKSGRVALPQVWASPMRCIEEVGPTIILDARIS